MRALRRLVNIIIYSKLSRNRGLDGVWGNDDGQNQQERQQNGVLCWNWGVIVVGVGLGHNEAPSILTERAVHTRMASDWPSDRSEWLDLQIPHAIPRPHQPIHGPLQSRPHWRPSPSSGSPPPAHFRRRARPLVLNIGYIESVHLLQDRDSMVYSLTRIGGHHGRVITIRVDYAEASCLCPVCGALRCK